MNKEEFYSKHHEVCAKHRGSHWDYGWFKDHVLGLEGDLLSNWFLETANELLKNGMNVIDLAGGMGHFGIYLKKIYNKKFDYTVVDLPVMRRIAKDYRETFGGDKVIGNRTYFVESNLCKSHLLFLDDTFDMVWMFTWFQIECLDVWKLFKEINRILKPNGILMFNCAHKTSPISIDMKELAILLGESKFKNIDIRTDSDVGWQYFVVARKK